MLTKSSVILIAALVLTGCATTKQELTSYDYEKVAVTYAGSHRCVIAGHIPPENAALGMNYSTAGLSGATYDASRLQQRIDQLENLPSWPSEQECNQLAITIEREKQRIATNNQNNQANQEAWDRAVNNRSKQTYCNKIGTQLFCNTY